MLKLKACMEHLISYVTIDKKIQFYRDMCSLLKCPTQAQFNSKYVEFKITWATKKLVLNNIAIQWAKNCKWRGM